MRRARYFLLPLALIVVVVFNIPAPIATGTRDVAEGVVAPYRNVLSLLIHRVQQTVAFLGDAAAEGNRYEAHLQELAELRDRLRVVRLLEEENRALREQLMFAVRRPERLVLCEVVSRGDPTGWWNVVRLNKGTRDGIAEGACVITIDGLLGRVIAASTGGCDVLLLIDPGFKVSCRIEGKDSFGILKGSGFAFAGETSLGMIATAKPCRMDFVQRDYTLEVGDRVVTSGLGGTFPEGVDVGLVESTEMDESGLYQRVRVIPAANLQNTRYAFVVLQ